MRNIVDNSKLYYFMIPNLIDAMDLSVYAFRLYCHLKKVTGENGECWQSTSTMAEICQMGSGSISRAKNELVEAGLIKVTKQKGEHGGRDYDLITLIDVWEMNRSTRGGLDKTAPNSQQEFASSHDEPKNTPIKNIPEDAGASSVPATPGVDFFKAAFHAKRLNPIQYQAVLDLESKYDLERLKQAITWAATAGMAMGHAILAIQTALPKWDKPKPNGNGHGGPTTVVQQNLANMQQALSEIGVRR